MSQARFTDIEKDAVLELINIGVGKAAAALSTIAQQEIVLSVPSFEFIEYGELVRSLEQIDQNDLSVISQYFNGDFSGTALLLFPDSSGMLLVRQMLRDMVQDEHFSELEGEALVEVGNIILNACFGQLGELLSTELDSRLPKFIKAEAKQVASEAGIISGTVVMMLQVDFYMQESKTKGFLMFVMDSM